MVGQAPWLPGIPWRKAGQSGVCRAWQGPRSGPSVGKTQGRQEGRGRVGKIRPVEPEGPQCEP